MAKGLKEGPTAIRALRVLVAFALLDLGILLLVVWAHAATGDPGLVGVAGALLYILAGLAAASLALGFTLGFLRYPARRMPALFILMLTLAVLIAHAYIIDVPSTNVCGVTEPVSNGCIMDEGPYYVPAAQLLLNGTQCGIQTLAGNLTEVPSACNLEHPFLGKAFIAAGMAIFGDNDVGYRIFQAILGSFSVPLLFFVALRLSGSGRVSSFASLFLAIDVMFFAHSSAGLIDVQPVFFVLLAELAYSYGLRVWKVDRYLLTGLFLGLAGLSKETAIFGALAVVTYVMLIGESGLRRRLSAGSRVTIAMVGTFLVGLQIYDSLFAGGSFPLAVNQLQFIVQFGASITGPLLCAQNNAVHGLATGPYWCKFPDNIHVATPILPQDWLVYYTPVRYYVTPPTCAGIINALGQCTGLSYIDIGYYGVTNLVVTWAAFAWVPLVGYTLLKALRVSAPEGAIGEKAPAGGPAIGGELKFAGLGLIWFLWNYLPYFVIQYGLTRVTYPYYMVPAVPGLAIGASYLVTRRRVPLWAALIFAGAAFGFFLVYFPYKGFLPIPVRAFLGN